MSLVLKSLSAHVFRNYQDFSLRDLGMLTIFVGDNAVGKTNLIEAIQLLTEGRTFRHSTTNQLVSWEKTQGKISLTAQDNLREIEISLQISESAKQYFLNGKKKRSSEILGILPSVLFTPDDLMLVKGSPSKRRAELDLLGYQLSANYRAVGRDYAKLLQQRNALLKERVSSLYIQSVDDVLVKVGARLVQLREELVSFIRPVFERIYRKVSGRNEVASIAYYPSWVSLASQDDLQEITFDSQSSEEEFLQALKDNRSEEQVRKRTLVGPHLDSINFYISRKNATVFASQGQQRSCVLAFKLAELEVIKNRLGQRPILLLDDVMSELDIMRREALMRYIDSEIQTFITTVNLDYFSPEIKRQAQIIHLPAAE